MYKFVWWFITRTWWDRKNNFFQKLGTTWLFAERTILSEFLHKIHIPRSMLISLEKLKSYIYSWYTGCRRWHEYYMMASQSYADIKAAFDKIHFGKLGDGYWHHMLKNAYRAINIQKFRYRWCICLRRNACRGCYYYYIGLCGCGVFLLFCVYKITVYIDF